jgi:Flp pilus assembly protein TadD
MANDAGHQQAAIDHFNASLLLKPDQPKVYSNLGAALVDNGQLQQGIESFQQL